MTFICYGPFYMNIEEYWKSMYGFNGVLLLLLLLISSRPGLHVIPVLNGHKIMLT